MSTPAFDIKRLNASERLQLIEDLWDSLRSEPASIPLTDAQRQELNRRLDAIERGDTAGIPWNEVLNRVRNAMR
jgi:putative addiction module component (TIGR02574 family)